MGLLIFRDTKSIYILPIWQTHTQLSRTSNSRGLSHGQIPVVCGTRYLQCFADVIDLDGLVTVELPCEQYFRFIKKQSWASTFPTAGTSSGKSGFGSLLDQATFKLGQCGEDVEYSFAGGTRCVDHTIIDRPKSNSLPSKVFDQRHQMPH